MIQLFVGNDTQTAKKAARTLFERSREENPQARASYFDDILFDQDQAVEVFSSENLFGDVNIIYFDGILEHPLGESFYRTTLKETPHIVLVRETKPPKDLLLFLSRLGEITEFVVERKNESRENSFAVASALGNRDKKLAWVEFEKLRRGGIAMEEVHGTIFWAVKSMFLAKKLSKDEALSSGMKEFTYRNYGNYAKKYSFEELKEKLDLLKELYHSAHRGEVDFESGLEQFLLKN